MTRDPLRYFRIEARELVDQLNQGVLDLDRTTGPEPVARLLRVAHTLKGAARVVRQIGIADRAHAVEEVLVPHRDSAGPVPATEVTALLRLADQIAAEVAALPAAHDESGPADPGSGASPSPAPGATSSPATPNGVAGHGPDGALRPGPQAGPAGPGGDPAQLEAASSRPDANDVDDLLDAVSETHTRFSALRRATVTLNRVQRTSDSLADQLRGRLDGPNHHPARPAALRLAIELSALTQQLTDAVEQAERELDEVRGRAERLRLVAASGIFTPLRRAVRDVAGEQDKHVVFDSIGGDLRLDPQILTQVGGALLHVVRNAVAHGIEPGADRLAAGKPAEGRVTVEVVRRGRFAAFSCRDDGRGFDLAAVRRVAEAKGHLATNTQDLVDLVLHGGISTSERVTEVSGRGIGLDVARDVAEQFGGTASIDTTAGAGTTVELVVPLSLVSVRGLVVETAGRTVSLPLDAVRTCVRIRPEEYSDAASAGALPHAGQVLAFMPLSRMLSGDPAPPPAGGVAVVVEASAAAVGPDSGTGSDGGGMAAVGVDRILGTATMVVRPLPELAPSDGVVAGTCMDAEGNPRLVLDPDGLVAAVRGANGAGRRVAGRPPDKEVVREPILVIDDSLTTRMLERSILESAGYPVDLAASGEEALDKARSRRYALFLTDIDMPGMDGFTFVEITRADPDLREVPAILVSSRSSAEDRRRGAAAGASAYVVKSEFNQDELLSLIGDLVVT